MNRLLWRAAVAAAGDTTPAVARVEAQRCAEISRVWCVVGGVAAVSAALTGSGFLAGVAVTSACIGVYRIVQHRLLLWWADRSEGRS